MRSLDTARADTPPLESDQPIPVQRTRRRMLADSAAYLGVAIGLSACGGSDDDLSVSLSSEPSSGAPGTIIVLTADVDSDGEDAEEVRFYRGNSSSNVLLGTLNSSPYELQTTVPSDSTEDVLYFARVVSESDDQFDSSVITFNVTS